HGRARSPERQSAETAQEDNGRPDRAARLSRLPVATLCRKVGEGTQSPGPLGGALRRGVSRAQGPRAGLNPRQGKDGCPEKTPGVTARPFCSELSLDQNFIPIPKVTRLSRALTLPPTLSNVLEP